MRTLLAVAAAAGLSVVAAPALAQSCCPSGGSGTPARVASVGLGESAPVAQNVSADPEWSVYEFARDGIRYLQINDIHGVVRAAVGNVGGVAWIMPMGADVNRVVLGTQTTEGEVIYSSEVWVVKLIKGANGVSWVVVPQREG